jgi:hypothetical protein
MVDPRDAELAACPFCGSRASLEGVRDGCQVICNGNHRKACFARGPVVYHGPGGWDACRAEAIAAWNTRTRPPEPLAGSGVAGESVAQAEERIMQEWRWGNLTKLGVASHLTRAGFRQQVAIEKASALAEATLRTHPAPDQSAHCSGEVVEAARGVIERASDTYRKRNGQRGSIEGDDGEKCWIVSFDDFEDLRRALAALGARHD